MCGRLRAALPRQLPRHLTFRRNRRLVPKWDTLLQSGARPGQRSAGAPECKPLCLCRLLCRRYLHWLGRDRPANTSALWRRPSSSAWCWRRNGSAARAALRTDHCRPLPLCRLSLRTASKHGNRTGIPSRLDGLVSLLELAEQSHVSAPASSAHVPCVPATLHLSQSQWRR